MTKARSRVDRILIDDPVVIDDLLFAGMATVERMKSDIGRSLFADMFGSALGAAMVPVHGWERKPQSAVAKKRKAQKLARKVTRRRS